MATIWKIAPGNHAKDWDLFLKWSCIGIGWLDGQDFRRFKSESDILSELRREYGKGTSGYGAGAAAMIYSFTHEIQAGDVVIANQGYNHVMGVGIVSSDYLPPTARNNPLRTDSSTHRHHVRMVDWIITKQVDLRGSKFFVQRTLAKMNEDKVLELSHAYRNNYAKNRELKRQLERLLGVVTPVTRQASDLSEVPPERAEVTTYRVLRDSSLARRVKMLHEHKCQICCQTIELPDGTRYAEAHHIKPLGQPHSGPDTLGNILCLCPNHHAECDLGACLLSSASLKPAEGHEVDQKFIDYHNSRIYAK